LTAKRRKEDFMKRKFNEFIESVLDRMEYSLKRLCGKPSPMKRFIVVLTLGGVFAIANIYLVVSSIYSMGKNSAKREMMEMMEITHIQPLELKQREDSVPVNK